MEAPPARVDAVRSFNRFYTRSMGVLRDGLLGTPYSLTEARVLYELGRGGAHQTGELRRALALDSGYLSRLLARLEAAGLVEREQAADDARRRLVRLTAQGREAFTELDARSSDEITGLLAPLDGTAQARLLAAMATIRSLLEPVTRPRAYLLRPPAPGDLGWVVQRHGALYAEEYGWDAGFEALVAGIVAGYARSHDLARERAWIAELDGAPAGCVLCVRRDDETAQLRLLLVEPWARGLGLGSRLTDLCVAFARTAGYRRIVLWTNDVLVEARRIYERAGFTLVEQAPRTSFGHDLVEQTWALELGAPAPRRRGP